MKLDAASLWPTSALFRRTSATASEEKHTAPTQVLKDYLQFMLPV